MTEKDRIAAGFALAMTEEIFMRNKSQKSLYFTETISGSVNDIGVRPGK
jgi:hypothetical protein